MDFNPHSLHQILSRIQEQMRCPQCGTFVAVDMTSVKIASDGFMLLQLKCESCTAFIVLHVNLTGQIVAEVEAGVSEKTKMMNASSSMSLSTEDMQTLRSALKAYDGSFDRLFADFGKKA